MNNGERDMDLIFECRTPVISAPVTYAHPAQTIM